MPAVPSRLAPDCTGRSPTTITCKRQGIRPDLARCRQGVDALRFRHRGAVRQSFGWPVPKLALTNLRRRASIPLRAIRCSRVPASTSSKLVLSQRRSAAHGRTLFPEYVRVDCCAAVLRVHARELGTEQQNLARVVHP